MTTLLFFLIAGTLETGTLATSGINGYVRDGSTGEPLISANVFIPALSRGAVTNQRGFFTLAGLPAGVHKLRVSYLGYQTLEKPVEVTDGKMSRVTIELKPADVVTGEILVEDEGGPAFENTVSTISLSAASLQRLPSIGEPDILRTLKLIPGVQSVNEISSGLYIRGGSPDQNLILLDGVTVYNPSHLFGFFSTFNPDAVKDVKLMKGGFPVEYGGRLAAVLDVTNKDGNRNKTDVSGGIGLISSRLQAEGPWKYGSYMISGRRTYLDLFTSLVDSDEIPDYYFYDFNFKMTVDAIEDNRLALSVYTGDDILAYNNLPDSGPRQKLNLDWGNRIAALEWTRILSDDWFITTIGSYSRFYNETRAELGNGFDIRFVNQIEDWTVKSTAEYAPSPDHRMKVGASFSRFRFSYNNRIGDTGFQNNIVEEPWLLSAFIQDDWRPDALLTLTPGVRYTYYAPGERHLVEPRLQARYQQTENLAFTASAGHYIQYTTVNVNDVASFADLWFPIDETIRPQTAQQYIAGMDYRFGGQYLLNIETYVKPMQNITEFRRENELNERDLNKVFFIGKGLSRGFEVFMQKQREALTGWIGYTWSETERQFDEINNGDWYPAKWDFTHNIVVTATYDLGNRWSLGGNFVYTTGSTYTVPTGYYELGPPGETRKYLRAGPKNAYRLEPYHRMDLSAARTWEAWGASWRLSFNIYNVYNHRNVWFRDYEFSEPGTPPAVTDVRLIPILPTVELSFKF